VSADSRLAELYREAILANAAEPFGHGVEIDPTHRAEGVNPLCGDHVELHLRVADDRIEAAAFHGESCAICTASAALLCRHLSGQSTTDALAVGEAFRAALDTGEIADCPEELQPLMGVRAYPVRVQCARLPWETLTEAFS